MDDLQEEMAVWLSNETWNWTTYATLTFERPMKKNALYFAKVWVRSIARIASEVSGFCFQETHSDGQALHVHCLLSIRRNRWGMPSNEALWSWWKARFGRNLVLQYERPKPQELPSSVLSKRCPSTRLATYLTKYVVKEGSSRGFDWDFYCYSHGKEIDSSEFPAYAALKWRF